LPSASAPVVAPRAELRQDIERDQWLGFALTEACFFYGLVGGFIAAFLF
jgi:F-type H+-transporting ATPase subunit c